MNEREKPILFSAAMVRAILDGSKTQTRRIVKNADYFGCLIGNCLHWDKKQCAEYMAESSAYGPTGRRLWVRETWRRAPDLLGYGNGPTSCEFRATHKTYGEVDSGKWKPSIFMPRWACRIELEVVDIRVERLQDISEADVIAEGCIGEPCDHSRQSCEDIGCPGPIPTVGTYWNLWESINGPGSWDANPFVWVIEFKVVK